MLEENTEKQEMPKRPRGAFSRHGWIFLLVIIIVGAVIYAYFPKGENKRPPVAKPGAGPLLRTVPVVAVPAKEGEMKIYLNGLGSVTPLNTVTVKSRVDGQLMEVLFKEGQIVTSGQLLARLDPRPFEVQLTQAEGQLARDQALLKNAVLDLQRYRELWQQDSIPKQQLDTQEALVRQYEGNLKVDQGQIDNAKLQLIYCRITVPDRRTGRSASGGPWQYHPCRRSQWVGGHYPASTHLGHLFSARRQHPRGAAQTQGRRAPAGRNL